MFYFIGLGLSDEKDITVYTATVTFAGLWIGDSPIPEPDEDHLS